MAPTDPEWMLWAKRLRDEHKVLLLRIDENTQTTIQTQALQEQIKELTANSQQLQRRNDALEERILRLEQDSSNQEPTFGLEIKGLKSRITGLEKELHRTSGNSEKAVGEPPDWHPQRHDKYVSRQQVAEGRLNFRSRASDVVSKTLSETTTTAESTPVNEKPEIRTRSTARETISIEPQGRTTLEEYFMYGETSVTRAVQLYERRAVKAFVTGIASKNLRMNLWERLDEEGWTWQKAREQTHKMMKDRQKKSKK